MKKAKAEAMGAKRVHSEELEVADDADERRLQPDTPPSKRTRREYVSLLILTV